MSTAYWELELTQASAVVCLQAIALLALAVVGAFSVDAGATATADFTRALVHICKTHKPIGVSTSFCGGPVASLM